MSTRIIGIAGGTASGKTTLAEAVAKKLGDRCVLLTHDRYYKSMPPSSDSLSYNFDHPDALDTPLLVSHLADLRAGKSVRVPVYDYVHHCRSDDPGSIVHATEFILVEGILVLSEPTLVAQMHQAAFVYAPDDIRLIRRIRRDALVRGRTAEETMVQYLKTVRPMHQRFVAPSQSEASLVLDGTSNGDELVSNFMNWILPAEA